VPEEIQNALFAVVQRFEAFTPVTVGYHDVPECDTVYFGRILLTPIPEGRNLCLD
jgi:hypothetical protein